MEQVKQEALARAIRMLDAIGAQYAIVDPDGTKHGALELAEPKAKKTYQRTGINYRPVYHDKCKAMQPGDLVVLDTPDGMKTEALRGAVSAQLTHWFGKGACITSVKDSRIEILRVM